MAELHVATRSIVLGRGIERIEDHEEERWQLSTASQSRAEVMAAYYHQYKETFRRIGSQIICSGGYAGLALGQERPPKGISEASRMADYLVEHEVPSRLVEYEGESISTFSNFEECLRRGFFTDENDVFTPEDPLLLVASNPHGKKRGAPIARAAYGIEQSSAIHILPAERESYLTHVRETMGGIATVLAISEAQVQALDLDSLHEAALGFEAYTQKPSLLVPAAVRHMLPIRSL
jgi:hypothetical protein